MAVYRIAPEYERSQFRLSQRTQRLIALGADSGRTPGRALQLRPLLLTPRPEPSKLVERRTNTQKVMAGIEPQTGVGELPDIPRLSEQPLRCWSLGLDP